jgi:cobalamin-dependent methionine synthase I
MSLDFSQSFQPDLPEIPFPMKDIYRRIGMPEVEVARHSGVKQALEEALKIARSLIAPRGSYRFLAVRHRSVNTLEFANSPFILRSRQVVKLLESCQAAAFFMVTIGQSLENKVHELTRQRDVTVGFMLDAIASETADAAADLLHRKIIRDLAISDGYQVTARFSPGYGDWPITVQPDVLKICDGEKIGISVTESCMMIPRKSVSAVFGLKSRSI